MADLHKLKAAVLADGVIEDHEVEIIRQELQADGKIDERERKFVWELWQEAERVSPEFRQLFEKCMEGR
jgi:uncharacterized membrane protein YebE (DUF533 family)